MENQKGNLVIKNRKEFLGMDPPEVESDCRLIRTDESNNNNKGDNNNGKSTRNC